MSSVAVLNAGVDNAFRSGMPMFRCDTRLDWKAGLSLCILLAMRRFSFVSFFSLFMLGYAAMAESSPAFSKFQIVPSPSPLPKNAATFSSAEREPERLTQSADQKVNPELSPKRDLLIYGSRENGESVIVGVLLGTPQERKILAHGEAASWLADGSGFTYSRDSGRELYVVRLVDLAHPVELTRTQKNIALARVSPTGDRLVYQAFDREGFAIVDGRSATEYLVAHGGEPHWSSDGRHVVFTTDSGVIGIADKHSTKLTKLNGASPVLSPDNAFVLYATQDPNYCPEPRGEGPQPIIAGRRHVWIGRVKDGATCRLVDDEEMDDPSWATDGFVYFVRDGQIWRNPTSSCHF